MGRVSVAYDKKLKAQVLKVRGDERYTRSTKTILGLGTSVNHEENFDLPIHVDVYRDVGDGSLIIYDNDVVFSVIDDWASTDAGRDITLYELNYDIDHNIYVKYTGNGKCSPSLSKTEKINVKNPNVTTATITFDAVSTSDSTLTAQISLSNTLNHDYNKNQDINVYYDDILIDTYNTGNSESIDVTYSSLGDNGLHQLKAVFEGSNHLSEITNTYDISVGYKLEVLEYPALAFNAESATFKVQISDYLNNPISNKEVTGYSYVGETSYSMGSETSDENGLVEITETIDVSSCGGKFKFTSQNATDIEITIPIVNVTSINLTASGENMYIGESKLFTATINQQIANVPVTFTDVNANSSETIYTNSKGVAQISVMGHGRGRINFQASCAEVSTSLEQLDFITYWSKSEKLEQGDLSAIQGGILSLANIYRLDSSSRDFATLKFPTTSNSWALGIEGVTTPYSTRIGFASPNANSDGSIHTSNHKFSNGYIFLTYRNGSLTYQFAQGSTIFASGTVSCSNIPAISFRNYKTNQQQVSFKKVWYWEIE